MIEIVPCQNRFEELVQFVARLNSDGEHHIGFFGDGEADVRSSLAECLIPPAEGFRLAYENDQLVGIFGVDADPEVNRAWLFGPLVEHVDWHSIADKLYEQVVSIIPAGLRDHDLFCDEQNVHMQEFAARQGFPLHSENAILTLNRENYTATANGDTHITSFDGQFFARFEKLHNLLFPNTYFTARQLAEKVDETHRLFFAIAGSQLLGYHFCKVESETESGYIDFIGTDEAARGRGIGTDLLAAGINWMLSAPSIKKINLTVNADNIPARRLYEKFGFVTERVMRGYRKQIA